MPTCQCAAAGIQPRGIEIIEQAEAAYTTTVTSSLPQQIQKAQLDADSAKSAFEAADKVYNSRKDLFQQGALPRRELDAAEVALSRKRAVRTSRHKSNLRTCSVWVRNRRSNRRKPKGCLQKGSTA